LGGPHTRCAIDGTQGFLRFLWILILTGANLLLRAVVPSPYGGGCSSSNAHGWPFDLFFLFYDFSVSSSVLFPFLSLIFSIDHHYFVPLPFLSSLMNGIRVNTMWNNSIFMARISLLI
jgi:hypothetical protein